MLRTVSLIAALVGAVVLTGAGQARATEEPPRLARHDVAQPGDPVVTLRYFRIRKGSFPAFLKASEEGVWPFFEKIGARVVGMWREIHPAEVGATAGQGSPDYDEVWLMTRYASVDHWRATRDMARLGGNGPDYRKMMEGLAVRQSLTLETNVRFLSGTTWASPPQYLPSVD
ncbi:MAG: hypothetical protein KF911_07560 [Pseudomonadales bacterium]|nr:hypothetical protein [Pseudomonadales bacterium]